MVWPNYMIVALFAVIVGLVVVYGRAQARALARFLERTIARAS